MAATEHEMRLTQANVQLLYQQAAITLELNHMARKVALAGKIVDLLDTVSGDWNEACDLIAKWRQIP